MGEVALDLWLRRRCVFSRAAYWLRVHSYRNSVFSAAPRMYVGGWGSKSPNPPFWNFELHDCWIVNGEGREFV